MNRLEFLRGKLYEALDSGSKAEILEISRLLDKEILRFTLYYEAERKRQNIT